MHTKLAHTLAVVTIILTSPVVAIASDHYDGPAVLADPSIDITDMYVFPSPTLGPRPGSQMRWSTGFACDQFPSRAQA